MLSKNRNLILIVVLLAALVIFFVGRYAKSGNSNFRTKLPAFDSKAVTEIVISPPNNADAITLKLLNEKWMVDDSGQQYGAVKSLPNSLAENLSGASVKRVAATNSEKWAGFKTTDSLGTRIVLKEDGQVLSTIILGRFEYIQPQQAAPDPYGRQPQGEMISYVRVGDEEPVYAIDGMLALGMGKTVDDFRDKTILHLDKNSVNRMQFQYAEKGSFELKKVNGEWLLDGLPADSATLVNFLTKVSNIRGKTFASQQIPGSKTGDRLTVYSSMQDSVEIIAFKADTSLTLIESSQNPGNVFMDEGHKIADKIFVTKQMFLGQ